jgi:DNA-binding MarR family transcriptional regulator
VATKQAPPKPARVAPAAAGAALPMDDSLFFKLVRIVNLTARPFNEGVGRAHRLSLTQWRVMIVLASHPGIVGQDVALHTGLDKMSVSRALAGLVRGGRVVRRKDPADKRRVQLALSAAGERLYVRIGVAGKARETSLFAALDAVEQAGLSDILDRLIAHRLAIDAA